MHTLKKYSIAKRLTISLILTVGLVATLTISAIYLRSKSLALRELEKKADETIVYLVGALKIPLWQVSHDTIKLIGKSINRNEIVITLIISDDTGYVIYSRQGEAVADSIERSGKIYHSGECIGQVRIQITKKFYHENNRKQLISYGAILFLVLTSLMLATGMFIRKFLKKPLIGLNEIVESYKSGIYDSSGYQLPYLEFDHFKNVLEQMGLTIKAQMEDLKAAEEKYRSIFDNVTDYLFVHDLNGNLLETNATFKRLYGISENEPLRMNIREIIPAYNHGKFSEYLQTIREQGHHEGLLLVIAKDGSELIIDYRNVLVLDAQGVPQAVQGSGRDITHRIKSEKEKQHLEMQLRQAQRMEALGTLAGGIAHDFNNLLMGIQGRTSLMLVKIDAGSAAIEHLKGIASYVDRAAQLTKQLLGLARGGKYEIKPTDMNGLIESSSRMFGRTKKEIRIYRKLHDQLWTVDVDQGQMDQVLLNLFVNAWQAMPSGGDLRIETQNVRISEGDAGIYEVSAGDFISIAITDTGTGIDRDTLERIFDPFFSTKGMGRGTGLGLASTYGIIRNHGGYITVDSTLGSGSTFRIFLPASDKDPAAAGKRSNIVYGNKERILLIDDEELVLDVGTELLGLLNYEAIPKNSGKDALELFKSDYANIDLVILDMIMPKMSGSQVFKQLIAIKPDVLVLFSSGYSINDQGSLLLNRGEHGFIQKPFNIEQLSIKIREVLQSDPACSA